MTLGPRDGDNLFWRGIAHAGGIGILFGQTIRAIFAPPARIRQWLEQVMDCGVKSQPVVILTGMFTGSVLAVQAVYQLKEVSMQSGSGAIVGVGMMRELGPVITGVMLAGRVGAAMAAQLGTMRVTEQIDALEVLGISPVSYLVKPRLLAMLTVMPILMLEASFLGILCGGLLVDVLFQVDWAYYYASFRRYAGEGDLCIALVKSLSFGLLITMISCYQGLIATRGAVGVGQSTTRAMVWSSVAILLVNLLLTLVMSRFFPAGMAK